MSVTRTQKRRIKEEAGYRCAIPHCNITSPLEIHHILYQENGGTDEDENLICLCSNCHGRVHNGEIEDASIRRFKQILSLRAERLFPHEVYFLEALIANEVIELDSDATVQIRRIERNGYIRARHMRSTDTYRLSITQLGRNLMG